MTVIAGFFPEEWPILMGDLLISAPEIPGQPVNLPSVMEFSTIFPAGSGYIPTSTRQKVALVSNDLAIAWAGNAFAAKTVITDLMIEAKKDPPTRERLQAFFNGLDRTGIYEKLSFIGLIREQNVAHLVGHNCPCYQIEGFGPVYIAGTGTEDLKYFVDNLRANSVTRGERADKVVRAICTSLTISGGLLMAEVSTAQSLRQYYGAGYELTTFNSGRFRKLGDVTYIFWYVEADDEGFNVTPPREIFKYVYYDDILVIRTAHFNDPEHLSNLSFKDQVWMVPPIYRGITEEDERALRIPDMNSHFLCSYFLIRHSRLPLHTFARVDYRQDSQSLVRFKQLPGRIEFGLEPRYMEAITRSIDMHLRAMKVEEEQGLQRL